MPKPTKRVKVLLNAEYTGTHLATTMSHTDESDHESLGQEFDRTTNWRCDKNVAAQVQAAYEPVIQKHGLTLGVVKAMAYKEYLALQEDLHAVDGYLIKAMGREHPAAQ